MKKSLVKNLYSKSYMDESGKYYKEKIVINVVNFTGEAEKKDGTKVPFNTNKISLLKVKLNGLSGEEEHKAFKDKDGNLFTRPDKTELYLDIEHIRDIGESIDKVIDGYEEI